MKKRILSILLAAVMVIGLLPVMALAENGETVSTVELTLDDISEVFTTAFTEGLVQNALRSATHTNSEMYYV
ncbi:MAG: hypothetical protein HUJ65_03435, partial [Oscillospiraceae bacterium]|nr:hypothetical protein [Oscillospiraceae bacterium]